MLYRIKKLKSFFQFTMAKKIIIGSGDTKIKGWLSTSKKSLDVSNRHHFAKYWKKNNISNFLAEHVWEHLNESERYNANNNIMHYLKLGGKLRIAVPDGLHPSDEYINNVKPMGSGAGAEDHKILFNYKILKSELEDAGFTVELLEYWDEFGNFNFIDWSPKEGFVERSKDNDPRNTKSELNYTSLIIDAIKKK